MILQKEKKCDYWEIENLFDLCFTPNRYNLSSYQLRENVRPIEDLCFIARDSTKNVFAAVRYWPVKVQERQFLLLGPIAVHPTRQGEGHARHMIEHSLSKAEELGWNAVILIGDLSYYNQFDFKISTGLKFPKPTNLERILIRSLNSFNADNLKGLVKKC